MPEKCRRAKGATLELCNPAAHSLSKGTVVLQTLRNFSTQKTRQRLAIVKGKECAPMHYCPWCGSNIDTRPRVRPADKEDAT